MKRMKPEEAISEIGKTIFMADFHTHKISRRLLALAFQLLSKYETVHDLEPTVISNPSNSASRRLFTHIMLRFSKVEMADFKS